MLIVGFNAEDNFTFSRNLDIDPDTDAPLKIHNLLAKEISRSNSNIAKFNTIVCIENDEIVGQFALDEDYDLSDNVEDDEDDEELNPDHLTDVDEEDLIGAEED